MKSVLDSVLCEHAWEPGKVIPIVQGSQRHRIVVTCYEKGRQKAMFLNGEHNYGAYVEITRPDGSWVSHGNNIVPVLPDGRLIMVVEQRPPQGRFELPRQFVCQGKALSFDAFGPYSSLEFPGGAVDLEDKTFTAGFLRELVQETGVAEQTATVYRCERLFFPNGADMAVAMHQVLVELTDFRFEKFVEDDGGLHVLALTPKEVQVNIWTGAICSAQAGLRGWSFYEEVQAVKRDPMLRGSLEGTGYLSIEQVRVKI